MIPHRTLVRIVRLSSNIGASHSPHESQTFFWVFSAKAIRHNIYCIHKFIVYERSSLLLLQVSLLKKTRTLLLAMETQPVDTTETNAARVRLMALLALYDCLPPSIDGIAIPDFNPPPSFDSANDANSILHSLDAISQKLHIQGLESLRASVSAAGQSMSNTVCIFLFIAL
jgi:hypothetical protein